MNTRQFLLCGGLWLAFAGGLCSAQQAIAPTATAQTATVQKAEPGSAQNAKREQQNELSAGPQTGTEISPELRITRDLNPLPKLEVVTTRKADVDHLDGLLVTTMKPYLLQAYGVPPNRILGAPSWMDTQRWVINGKSSDEERDAMKKMTPQELAILSQMHRRGVLMDLFKMKAHIETRQMPYWELVPAKGGLKLKEVPAAPLLTPRAISAPTGPSAPGTPPPPGRTSIRNENGVFYITASAMPMDRFLTLISSRPEIDRRPVVNKTGFTGSLDFADFPIGMAGPASADPADSDAPSVFTTLQENFGLKLVSTKGTVEVVVIDSIEENTTESP